MAVRQTAALPLTLSGYFDTAMDAAYELNTGMNDRQRGFNQLMRDLGMRVGRNGVMRFDRGNPIGAYANAQRDAMYGAADRGFAADGGMRQMIARPAINEISKQASRARSDMAYENQKARTERRRVLAKAAKAAAQFGVKNETFLPPQR